MYGNYSYLEVGCYAGWKRYSHVPVLGGHIGNNSDAFVLQCNNKYKVWFTHRDIGKILTAESEDGFDWKIYTLGLHNSFVNEGGGWCEAINRHAELGWAATVSQPFIIRCDGTYYMWFTGRSATCIDKNTRFSIGHATSSDGVEWNVLKRPVVDALEEYEESRVSYPSVIYDSNSGVFKMWYTCGGEKVPFSIRYAESVDGVVWEKKYSEPILKDLKKYEAYGVCSCHVIKQNDWYYIFYTAFEDPFKSRICLARSRDGISCWERHPENPIITWGIFGTWDVESVSVPRLLYVDKQWRMYYTGRRGEIYCSGVCILNEKNFEF